MRPHELSDLLACAEVRVYHDSMHDRFFLVLLVVILATVRPSHSVVALRDRVALRRGPAEQSHIHKLSGMQETLEQVPPTPEIIS